MNNDDKKIVVFVPENRFGKRTRRILAVLFVSSFFIIAGVVLWALIIFAPFLGFWIIVPVGVPFALGMVFLEFVINPSSLLK